MTGQPVGPPVEVPIGERVRAVAHGGRLRRACRLLGEQLGEGALRVGRSGVVPTVEQDRSLLRAQQGDRVEIPFQAAGEGAEDGLQMLLHAVDGRGVEAAPVGHELERQRGGGLGDQGEGIAGAPKILQLRDLERAAALPQGLGDRIVLEHHHAFEQRTARGHVAPDLDLCERAVLVIPQLRHVPLQSLEPRRDPPSRRHLHAHREGIDEQADHRFDALEIRGPAGDGGAEEHVLLTAVAAEQEGPRALEQRVQGEPVPAGCAAQRSRHRR